MDDLHFPEWTGYYHVGRNRKMRTKPTSNKPGELTSFAHDLDYLEYSKKSNPTSFNPYTTFNQADQMQVYRLQNNYDPMSLGIKSAWAIKKLLMSGEEKYGFTPRQSNEEFFVEMGYNQNKGRPADYYRHDVKSREAALPSNKVMTRAATKRYAKAKAKKTGRRQYNNYAMWRKRLARGRRPQRRRGPRAIRRRRRRKYS